MRMNLGGIELSVEALLDLLGVRADRGLYERLSIEAAPDLHGTTVPVTGSYIVVRAHPGGIDELLGVDELLDERARGDLHERLGIEAALDLGDLFGFGDSRKVVVAFQRTDDPLRLRGGQFPRPWLRKVVRSARSHVPLSRGRRYRPAERGEGRLFPLWSWRVARRAAERRRHAETKTRVRRKSAVSFIGSDRPCLPVFSLVERAVQVLAHLTAFWRSARMRLLAAAARRLAGALVRRALTFSLAASRPTPPGRLVTSCARLLRGPNPADRTRICPFGGAAAA